ncbi:23S rRNA (uracil-C(5))-methyltransferase RlmCD [Caloramator mitchellensis]|uniref:23S rRNA (Uracil-C(5))-methyltransferase RlmCD n=1 Tax=Caloramator mitchellensis TaxID=908809 RepID=A0A0R3K002_CALMK|nr:23S rRNA (uracil(1939)-C(5))-methyltransferase RlmD [Caloramator mitchellensis]KRQ86162.1 23S rRNA (uracil-C(5))-methyltransferase RlmCD [Caloramator mitchellensis]
MKKKETYEVIINEVLFPNKGVVYLEDKPVYIKNALKGQKVLIRIEKNKKDYAEAKIIDVLEKALYETSPLCSHFGECGGCSYQTIPYDMQLEIKASQVKKLLDDAGINYEFLGIQGSPLETAYRNKMEFTFGDDGKTLALGLHKKGKFYEVVVTRDCKIVNDDFNKILLSTLIYFAEKEIPHYNKRTHEGFLRHLVVRRTSKTNEILVNIVTSSQINFDFSEYVEMLNELKLEGQIKGILHTINDSLSDVVQSDKTQILYGQDFITEEILGLKFKITAFSFFQTNSLSAENLYSLTREFAGETKDKVIFDLYSGTGTIAQIMAPVAKKVIGIEIVEEAVEAARENAKLNNLDNCEFIAGDVLKKVDELDIKPDIIILDPPRDGIHPKAIGKIINFKAPRLVYVSCKPTSLARDLKIFVENGYEVKKVKCVDMFPHTPHVETVVLIEKK